MARLTWGAEGSRFYETGVDRGVLYVGSDEGVAWSGIISVNESPAGGDPKPFYIDGFKYLNLSEAEEYEAEINAFYAPASFAPCDGTVSIQNGLFVTQQPRRPFSFCYRTLLGNDVDGVEHGYKIHLVYNALASPSSRDNASMSSSPEPAPFSWKITTLPPALTGYKPTSHFVIDSRLTDPVLLASLEEILYGSNEVISRLVTPAELITMFTEV